jgi:hypothetical protein
MQSLRRFPARNNVAGSDGIRLRAGVHGNRWRRPLAQKDVYRVVGRQVGPRRRGLLQHRVLGGTVVDVGDAAEA